jgi:hypothetical protein
MRLDRPFVDDGTLSRAGQGGSYFLSELLPVELTLENRTQQPIMLFGPDSADDLCQLPALQAQLSGGRLPSFHLIQDLPLSCVGVLLVL